LNEFWSAAVKASKRMVEAPRQPPNARPKELNEKPRSGKYTSRASRVESKYCVAEVEVVLHPKILRCWQQRLREVRAGAAAASVPMSCPVFAWHATPWHDNLNKIIDSGFLAPGEQDQASGQLLQTAHGAAYGKGVYTTPGIELTNCYGFRDRYGRRQVLLCLVNMGHTDVLENAFDAEGSLKFADNKTDGSSASWLDLESGADFDGQFRPYQALEQVMDEDTKEYLRKQFGGRFPSVRRLLSTPSQWEPSGRGHWQSSGNKLAHGRKGGANECFGFNSRISPDRRQYIAARSDQVLPVLLVTYEPRQPFDLKASLPPLIAPKSSPTVRFLPLVDSTVAVAPSSSSLRAANNFDGPAEAEQVWTVDIGKAWPKSQSGGTNTNNIHVVFVAEGTPATAAACVAVMRELRSVPPERIGAVFFPSNSGGSIGLSVGYFGEVTTPSALVSL
jgi:hypothetical protein